MSLSIQITPPMGAYNYVKVLYILLKYIDKTPATCKELWDTPEVREDLIRMGIKSLKIMKGLMYKNRGVYAWKENRMMGYKYMISLRGIDILEYYNVLDREGVEYYRKKVLSKLKKFDPNRYDKILKIMKMAKRHMAKLNKS